MKRIVLFLSALLLITLLMPCVAPAETTEVETVLWTGEDGLLSFDLPAAWNEVTDDVIEDMLQETIDSGKLDEYSLNEDMKEKFAQTNHIYAVFWPDDLEGVLNISVRDSAESGGASFVKLAKAMLPLFKEQYEQMGITVENIEVSDIGMHECLILDLTADGSTQKQIILMSPDGTKKVTFSFAESSIPYSESIVGSLTFAE